MALQIRNKKMKSRRYGGSARTSKFNTGAIKGNPGALEGNSGAVDALSRALEGYLC